MKILQIIAYHEPKFDDLGIIKNGFKTKIVPSLMNDPDNYTPPNEMFCLSLLICFYKTMKKYLSTKGIIEEISIKISCSTHKDKEGLYFKIDLLCGITNFDLSETQKIINFIHSKCPISRMLNNYPHFTLSSISYDEIMK
ncbi:MAG: OsmC family protein [Vigna little leaf phytoplasma]|nr:OsmC family protein [Vigna little leaf phytoplasma]